MLLVQKLHGIRNKKSKEIQQTENTFKGIYCIRKKRRNYINKKCLTLIHMDFLYVIKQFGSMILMNITIIIFNTVDLQQEYFSGVENVRKVDTKS